MLLSSSGHLPNAVGLPRLGWAAQWDASDGVTGPRRGAQKSWEAGKRGRLGGGAGQWEAQSMMSPRSSQHGSG